MSGRRGGKTTRTRLAIDDALARGERVVLVAGSQAAADELLQGRPVQVVIPPEKEEAEPSGKYPWHFGANDSFFAECYRRSHPEEFE